MLKIIKKLLLITILFILSRNVYAETCNVNDENGFCLRAGAEKIESGQFFGGGSGNRWPLPHRLAEHDVPPASSGPGAADGGRRHLYQHR